MSSSGKSNAGEVTRLLKSWSEGEQSALEQLTPLVYTELRKLSASQMRKERPDHTLRPTALVNEVFVRLVQEDGLSVRTRAEFFAIAANLMRQILIDHARERNAQKRGGGNKVALEEDVGVSQPREVELIALDAALDKLAQLDPRQSRIVVWRFFGGLNEMQIAGLLDVSLSTVKRDWMVAKAWLHAELSGK